MRIIEGKAEFQLESGCAAAIGKFDGIHRGHLSLLSHILEQRNRGREAVVFTFDPPASVYFGGEGDRRLLEKLAPGYGFEVQIIPKVLYEGREISSSLVREAVERGEMERACRLLGRNYSISGKVEPGRKLGRRLGMPTLNLYPPEDKLLPPRGVYYSRVRFPGGSCEGITNIGQKPTVNDTPAVSVETYLYGYEGDLYGEEIVTKLLHFRRPERKFRDVEELKRQMEADILAGKKYHKI